VRPKFLASLSSLALAFLLAAGCGMDSGPSSSALRRISETTTGGNAGLGPAAISRYGCGSCHIIPGVSGAVGRAGPPLTGIADRIYVAGVIQNTPPNLMRWIRDPHAIDEKTLMPNLGVTQKDAADIAAYLYTLK
jgi:cytochrome c